MATSVEAYQQAVVHHQAGRLREAELLYRQVLDDEPRHPDALHLLGVVAHQCGRPEMAAELISRAILLSGNQPAYHSNLGEVYRALGRMADACTCYRQALRLKPDYPEAHNNLGNALLALGQLEAAEASFREALRLRADFSDPHNNLGLIRQRQGDIVAATHCFRQALAINPHSTAALGNLATVLKQQGLVGEAIAVHQQALALSPQNAELHANLGILLEGVGRYDEALAMYERATQLRPDFAGGYFCQGSVYQTVGKSEQAVAAYERALALKPDYVEALNNLSALYNDLSRTDEALECAERGLALAPAMGSLHANRQVALHAQGRADEAVEAGRRALELRPHDAAEHSNFLYTLNFHWGYDAETIFSEHLKWGRLHAEPLTARAAPHANDRSPLRRLRVGYLSPYFRQHAVNYFVEPILASHDHEQFEVFCYADMILPDDTTARLKQSADQWRDVRFLSDHALAEQIRSDRIDILVDLTGHIGGNRMLVFARKPAPVQVTYIGYQNTTGMSAMDYRLTDARADPPGLTDRWHTERLVRLERSYFCYQPSRDAPPVTPLPAQERGYVTYGSFNNFAKVTPTVRDAWWQILKRAESSRLMVLAYRGGYLEATLKADAAGYGIEPERIELFDKRPRLDYLSLINQADIALDPFPFNGHTTTCDAIWQGVPVVMLQGQTYVSRFGGSVLANVGLESLITDSVDDYVDAAVSLGEDLDRLAALRGSLRATMAASPLLDFAGFTRILERAYRAMWSDWCERAANSRPV